MRQIDPAEWFPSDEDAPTPVGPATLLDEPLGAMEGTKREQHVRGIQMAPSTVISVSLLRLLAMVRRAG